MTYRFRLSSNPRAVLLPLISVAIVAGAVALIIFANVLLGIITLIVGGFIGYHVMKLFVNTLRSAVETSEDDIACAMPMGREIRIQWQHVTHAGSYTDAKGERDLFVYSESEDRLLTIPPQYEDTDNLEQEILEKSGIELLRLSGEDPEDLADALREIVAPEDEIIDDESE
jgi:hypothetical protein